MSTLARLVSHLPLYFDRDPAFVTALTVFYNGNGGTVSITNRTLSLRVIGGMGASLSVPLIGKTVSEVAGIINGAVGYQAIMGEGQGGLSADSLYEVQGELENGAKISAFSSLLWRVLAPLAWVLEEGQANILAGQAQMTIPTAGGTWLDWWGDLYGGVFRLSSETDQSFSERIMREIRRVRLTIPALVTIIEEELGVRAEIRNLHEDAWIVAETNFGFLAGRRHARTTFEVRIDRTQASLSTWFDARLRYLVDRNRAAGTLPFYVSLNRGGNLGESGATSIFRSAGLVRSAVRISSPLTWIINEGQLGNEWLSLPANVGALVTVTTRAEADQGEVLILGQDTLGTTELGED